MHPSELWNSVGGGFKESKKVWLDLVVWVSGDAAVLPWGQRPSQAQLPGSPAGGGCREVHRAWGGVGFGGLGAAGFGAGDYLEPGR